MLKRVALHGPGGRVVLTDTITKVGADDAGALVVSGSHGGTSSGEFALVVPLALAVFNDAGIGKDEAGIAALAMLQARGVPACAVAHTSARIGEALDTWEHGIISRVNAAAQALGLREGLGLRGALEGLAGIETGTPGGPS
jgi:hypothetical protein